jgi:hypothetical protein
VLGGVGDAELDDDLAEVADGVVSDRDGDDYESDLTGERSIDRLGRPVRFARSGDRIAASLSTPQAQAWLSDDDQSLADDASLAAVAAALDAADVVSAALFTFPDGPSLDPRATEELLDRLGVEPPSSFASLGLGWAADDGDAVMTAVYDFGDDATASDMVAVVETAFREGTSLVSQRPITDIVALVDVAADGRLVIATLAPGPEGRPGDLFDMVVRRDLPFASRS